jgi:hypothetical protein
MKKQKIDRKQLHDRFLTTEEAADFLSLSATTLQTYRQRNTGPLYHQLADRTIRYRFSDVIQFGCKKADRQIKLAVR